MPSSDSLDDEAAPAPPKKPTTPRRSPAVKRTRNATPNKKAPANKASTPNSAPAIAKAGTKKPEQTLLNDFLLGRPSANRPRRKSVDVVKVEMKRSAISNVPPPKGVKDRVKQWQKASAAAAIETVVEPASEPDEMFERIDEESVTERDRRRIKFRKQQNPVSGRRKSVDKEDLPVPPKVARSPKKRVVSDDHWVTKEKKSPPRTPRIIPEIPRGGSTLPKDFLKLNPTNTPLERKISDWAKRIANEEGEQEPTRQKRFSRNDPADRKTKSVPSKAKVFDEGIRVVPIREKPSHSESKGDFLNNDGRRKVVADTADGYHPPRRKSEKVRNVSPDVINQCETGSSMRNTINANDDDNDHDELLGVLNTPTRPSKNKAHQRRSLSPVSLSDIPVGYSAFSVLDVPIGGDINDTRKTKPQRQPSLSAVPKVLKRVYNEGLKIVHDTVDPPRIGINQPPSIESWLKGTSDPFLDDPSAAEAAREVPRYKSTVKVSITEESLMGENPISIKGQKSGVGEQPKRHSPTWSSSDEHTALPAEDVVNHGIPVGSVERNIQIKAATPLPAVELKRSPATRNTSTPKSSRKPTPKAAYADTIHQKLEPCAEEESSIIPKDIPKDVAETEEKLPTRRTSEGVTAVRSPRDNANNVNNGLRKPSLSRSPRMINIAKFDTASHTSTNSLNDSSRRRAPSTGQHRLSTIASVETFNSSSPVTGATSDISHTTITQTALTQKTSSTSNTSHTSFTAATKSDISRRRSEHPGLKRRLTKHSDLLSVLSLPDASAPGRSKSIKSARSVRTARSRLNVASIRDLLRELAEDEAKYMRELKTLVDGVIPVLLSCVLSKSESVIAAGLFSSSSSGTSDASVTKPIVDMGVALERLKISHRHIPLLDPDMLAHWALGAHKVYEEYLTAWRMGFQHVVVNLAPASNADIADDQLSLDEMPRNGDGDILNENGERVDVAFLLKRPLARVKYLAKVLMGISTLKPAQHTIKAKELFEGLLIKTRLRMREEEARLVDQAANNIDATRARDPKTLAPAEGVVINPTRQVSAKDFFDLTLPHSSGQRIDCRVEVLLRDKPLDKSDIGDVLICEVDTLGRWLLLPPIEVDHISARPGDTRGELIVMIRGTQGSQKWHELLKLSSGDDETASEWIEMLGLTPRPPPLLQAGASAAQDLPTPDVDCLISNTNIAEKGMKLYISSTPSETDVPIGERRRAAEDSPPPKHHIKRHRSSFMGSSYSTPTSDGRIIEVKSPSLKSEPKDLNDAMSMAGELSRQGIKPTRTNRYRSRYAPEPLSTPSKMPIGYQEFNSEQRPRSTSSSQRDGNSNLTEDSEITSTRHKTSRPGIPEDKAHSPLKESTRPNDLFKNNSLPNQSSSNQDDEAHPPRPPPHRTSVTTKLEKTHHLALPMPNSQNRRSSSPLKHEYRPSEIPTASPTTSESESDDYDDSSDSSEEELEAVDLSMSLPRPQALGKKVSPAASIYNLPNGSLAPSNSASQVPYRGVPSQPNRQKTQLVAAISCWSHKGRWVDLHPEECSILVSPGLIEAFTMTASRFLGLDGNDNIVSSGSSEININMDAGANLPLVALELTPIVPLRQSNALDIEIRSPPTAQSTVKCTHTVRFRSHTLQDCKDLYSAIHTARLENPVYKKLEQERLINSYGKHSYQEAANGNRRRSWFGRSKSYRASTRAPSVTVSDNSSNSFASAISRLRSMGGLGGFNIAKSSVGTSQGTPGRTQSGPTSDYTTSSYSASSRTTPPHTPSGPSSAMTAASNVASLGSTNLRIRLYLLETSTKWNELGNASLTVAQPPRGMRQASSMYHGVEKRIIVTKREGTKRNMNIRESISGSPKLEALEPAQVLLDVVIGGGCFSRLGVVGIVMNVWEDIVGDNGEVGTVGAVGGVSGRTRKWLFQCASAAEATWIFALVGGGGR